MTHNTARNWAITLGITSALALTGCTVSNGAATPTRSDGTYAGYNSAAGPARDSVGWGLSHPVPSSLVSMAGVGSSDELWVYFQQSGVNTTGKRRNDTQADSYCLMGTSLFSGTHTTPSVG